MKLDLKSNSWLPGLALFLAVFAVYTPVWWAGFVWDDREFIITNPVIVGPLGLKEIWTTKAADICPLSLTTFWIEYRLWGAVPIFYHLVNMVLHGANSVILFEVLKRLQVKAAWLGAALWALHPIQVESVAWASELKNVQSGLFFLLSVLFFLRCLAEPEDRQLWRWNHVLALLFGTLAMASKSSTVILPLVLCLCAWWMTGRWRWRFILIAVPLLAASAASVALSMWIQDVDLETGIPSQMAQSWPERFCTAGSAIWFYVGKLIWPVPLVAHYPRWIIDASNPLSYVPITIAVAVTFALWFFRQSWARPLFMGWACFLVCLSPVLGFVTTNFFRYSYVADHFVYLASIGPLALAGASLCLLGETREGVGAWILPTVGGALAMFLGLLSWRHAWAFENELSLWIQAAAANPNSALLSYNLAAALEQNGQKDDAIREYRHTLELDPHRSKAIYNLSGLLIDRGQVDDAIAMLRQGLASNPDFSYFHDALGVALALKGQTQEAIAEFRETLRLKPGDVDAQNNLNRALAAEAAQKK